jgi:hypothetical protein
MPQKIRQLKAALAKAGFVWRPGKGSHMPSGFTPPFPDIEVTVSGRDEDDTQTYQVRQVNNALQRAKGK